MKVRTIAEFLLRDPLSGAGIAQVLGKYLARSHPEDAEAL